MNQQRLVYMNGTMIPEKDATISIFDVGRLYGATFYESIRTFKHTFFKLEEHLKRLERSLRYAGFLKDVDMDKVREAVDKTLAANIHHCDKEDDMWLCVEVTPGEGFPIPTKKALDATPNIFCYVEDIPHYDYIKYYREGKHVVTSLFRNIPPQCYEQRCKNRSRLSHYLSKLEGKRIDPDAFALMLDIDGYISEGTGANIFFVLDGVLYTPTTRNILVGISRNYAMELARKLGIEVVEADLTLYEAYNAEEAFWTTSSYCILPISLFDGKQIGTEYPGPIARKLLDKWSEEVGVDIIGQSSKFAG